MMMTANKALFRPSLNLHRDGVFGEVSKMPVFREVIENPPNPRTGTNNAVNYLRLGVPPYCPHKPSKRGGARNFASNETDSLSVGHIGKLIAATGHANAIGLPFNRFITIHWEAAGIAPAGIAKATGRYIDLLSKLIARHKASTALIWVQESGHGKGGHVHILAHVPAGLVKLITSANRKWLRSITRRIYKKRVIKSNPIGGQLNIENSNPELHLVNQDTALAYVLKSANAKAGQKYDLVRLEPGGVCVGKRCGMSQNIGPKAQSNYKNGEPQ